MDAAALRRGIVRRKKKDALFALVGLAATLVGLITLLALLIDLAIDGVGRINPGFLSNFPSRFPDKAGILSAWVGTAIVMFVTALSAVPLGVAAGVYLEEYAPKNRLTSLIEINIANLAGVPSIVYGLMALGIFVYKFNLGQSVITAGLTLALLILPLTALPRAPLASRLSCMPLVSTLVAVRWSNDHPLSNTPFTAHITDSSRCVIASDRSLDDAVVRSTLSPNTWAMRRNSSIRTACSGVGVMFVNDRKKRSTTASISSTVPPRCPTRDHPGRHHRSYTCPNTRSSIVVEVIVIADRRRQPRHHTRRRRNLFIKKLGFINPNHIHIPRHK